jgi:hypothetical protein
VLLFYCLEYLKSLPVSRADSVLLSTHQPALTAKAIEHILRGSLNRAVLAALLAALALSLLWISVASIGRLAVLRGLLEYFRGEISPGDGNQSDPRDGRSMRALLFLNFLRLATILAGILALAGAAILSGFASSDAHPKPVLAFLLFVFLAGMVCFAGSTLNWWLSLAPIFVVRDGETRLDALFAAVYFFRKHPGSVLAVSTWTGLAHLVVFSIATTVISVPLALVRVVPARAVIAAIALIVLAYLAVIDWIYVARLAGYVCIAEMPEQPLITPPVPLMPQGIFAPFETKIDRNESILSDLPGLASEM